jgi:hypothetical protein
MCRKSKIRCGGLICLISFVFVSSLTLTDPAHAELVAWWRLDEGAGTMAFDSSGNGNDAIFEGAPEWVENGKFGKALKFNGSSDYLAAPDSESLDINGDQLSIAAWINGEDWPAANHVVRKIADTGTGAIYMIRVQPDTVRVYLNTSAGETTIQGTNVLPTNEWVHIALIYDGAEARIYVNGQLDVSSNVSGEVSESNNELRIGRGEPAGYFVGMIDDVRLYNHALTESELLSVMEGSGAEYPFARGPKPADGALHPETWVNLTWRPGDFAVTHDVYLGDNFDDVNNGTGDALRGNQAETLFIVGFPGFAYPDGLVPGTTYYWRIDEVNETDPNSPWKGEVWSFSIPPKTSYNPDPADGAELVEPDVHLSWTAGFGAKLHTVYFGENFDDVNNATGGLPQGTATYTPDTLKMAKTYYWRVDEFDAIETYKGDLWSFTTQGAVGNPDPSNGAVDVKHTPTLTWSPGIYAASHQVYFGADEDAVKNADTGSPEYKGTGVLGSQSYDPGKLEWDTTYYWRIDEVNNTNPDSPWTGILWSFTTANFLVVDDFEDYDIGNNEIWWAWIDGLGYASHPTLPDHPGNGTGSMVGDETTGSYMEETIVHGGNQSMPVFYDNSILKYSEVEKTLTYPRDWTENGVSTLSIWFRGNSANAAETLYVALNGSAVVSHDNPNAVQITTWTQWTVDLQVFADQGVNLANVNTIALGLGNKKNPVAGASGTMYFDDIRLYPPPPEPAP